MKGPSTKACPRRGLRVRPIRRPSPGFTLIELLIAMVVVAILVTIAIPSYQFAMVKARRSAAQGCLVEQAQRMERYYTTNMSYLNAPAPTCEPDLAAHYTIGFSAAPTAGSYTLQIVPQGAQAQAETKCGTMTIDQTGRKSGSTTECWK